MNVRKLYQIKGKLEGKVEEIDDTISSRWWQLIGFGCGYFRNWLIVKDVVDVNYTNRGGDMYTDHIPIEFFEGNEKEAIIAYREHIKDVKKEGESRKQEREREKELGMLKKLTKKYPKAER